MKKALIIAVALCFPAHIMCAQQQVGIIRILPEDVIPSSVRVVPNGRTNETSVRWTYTEAGARKMLAFWEAHEGQKAITQVGNFTTPVGLVQPYANSPAYVAWKQGWLASRTDKFFSVSLEDAKKIVAGLKQ